jgi:hypothetical protein
MPVPLVRLPELEVPRNALLDFSALGQAAEMWQRRREFEARQALEQQRVGQEGERIGIERQRAGYEGQRVGLEGQRVGIEQGRYGLEQERQRQQQEEQERVRLGNAAATINGIADDTQRAAAWRTLVNSHPRLGEALRNNGQDPFDHRTGPQFIMSQVQDYNQRYRPELVTGAPGSVISEVSPGPGGATARPLISVPARPQNIGMEALKAMRDEGSQLQGITRLGSSFQDSFTMPGWGAAINAGDASNWMGRNLSNSSATMQAASQWWQDYQRSVELTQRHALFGSALTAPEQAAWRAATITPNMRPEAIRQNLATQQQILANGVQRYARSLVAAGYDPGPIAEAYGVSPEALGIPTARRVQTTPVGPQGAPPAAPQTQPPAGQAQTVQPSPAAPEAPAPQEGAIYRNPQTGQRIILRNGQWQPL